MTTETLLGLEEKGEHLLPVKTSVTFDDIVQTVPRTWQHVVILDYFVMPCKDGNQRVCNIMGFNEIGDDIPGSKCYVGIPALKRLFQLNMSKAQAKKCMLLALCYDKENSKTTT